jgi:hypothetical protein
MTDTSKIGYVSANYLSETAIYTFNRKASDSKAIYEIKYRLQILSLVRTRQRDPVLKEQQREPGYFLISGKQIQLIYSFQILVDFPCFYDIGERI